MKKIVLALVLAFSSLAFCAETLKIDFRYSLNGDDGKNHLHWQNGSTKAKDAYDAVSGASKKMSTKLLKAIQSENKKKVLPQGLYALLLFAVTSPEQAETDRLHVVQNGDALEISFVHRGNAYKVTTDEKGWLNVLTAFTIAQELATNSNRVFTIKPEFLQGYEPPQKAEDTNQDSPKTEPSKKTNQGTPTASGSTDWNLVDWEKVSYEPDKYEESAAQIWSGKLKAKLKNNVLTISGKLKKIDRPQKPEPKIEPKAEPKSDENPVAEDMKEDAPKPENAPAPI